MKVQWLVLASLIVAVAWTAILLRDGASVALGEPPRQGLDAEREEQELVAAPQASRPGPGRQEIETAEPDGEPLEGDGLASGRRSAREAMAEYWGARWSEIEAQIIEDGAAKFFDDPREVPPWSEAERYSREDFFELFERELASAITRLAMPWKVQGVTSILQRRAVNPERKEIGGPHLEYIEGMISSYEQIVAPICDDARVVGAAAFDRHWALERFRKAPIYVPSTERATRGTGVEYGLFGFSTASSNAGWQVYYRFRSGDDPTLEAVLQSIVEMREQFEDQLKEYIETI